MTVVENRMYKGGLEKETIEKGFMHRFQSMSIGLTKEPGFLALYMD